MYYSSTSRRSQEALKGHLYVLQKPASNLNCVQKRTRENTNLHAYPNLLSSCNKKKQNNVETMTPKTIPTRPGARNDKPTDFLPAESS